MVSVRSLFKGINAFILASTFILGSVSGAPTNTVDSPASPALVARASTTTTPTAAQVTQFKKYAELSATAYCRTVVPLNSWTCAHCLTSVPDGVLVSTFTSLVQDTNGFILRSAKDQTIYLVFRGTNSYQNAIVDEIYTLVPYSNVTGAMVHAGFLNAYQSVVSTYIPVLQAQLAAYPSYKVVVTGHSLGGALALLAGMDLPQKISSLNANNLSIYTYGCPRVGNPTFANYVVSTGITFSRTVHLADIVPHVPPVTSGFLHPGVESWIYADPSTIKICLSNLESPDCSNSVLVTSLTDHLTYFGINEGSCL